MASEKKKVLMLWRKGVSDMPAVAGELKPTIVSRAGGNRVMRRESVQCTERRIEGVAPETTNPKKRGRDGRSPAVLQDSMEPRRCPPRYADALIR